MSKTKDPEQKRERQPRLDPLVIAKRKLTAALAKEERLKGAVEQYNAAREETEAARAEYHQLLKAEQEL